MSGIITRLPVPPQLLGLGDLGGNGPVSVPFTFTFFGTHVLPCVQFAGQI